MVIWWRATWPRITASSVVRALANRIEEVCTLGLSNPFKYKWMEIIHSYKSFMTLKDSRNNQGHFSVSLDSKGSRPDQYNIESMCLFKSCTKNYPVWTVHKSRWHICKLPELQPLPRRQHADQRSRVHSRPLGGVQVVEAAPLPRQAGPRPRPLLMDQVGDNAGCRKGTGGKQQKLLD